MSGYHDIEAEIESLVLPEGRIDPGEVEYSQRRRLVLALALEAHRVGYEVVSVDTIAETAQLSKTTLYALFKNKEGLLENAIGGFCDSAKAGIDAAVAAEESWQEAVKAACRALLDAVADDPGPARLAFVEVPAVVQDGSDLELLGSVLDASYSVADAPKERPEGLIRLATLGGLAAPIWDRLVRGKFGEIRELTPSLAYLLVNAHYGPEAAHAVAG
jgi:AcrR family transcriptional regulator